AEKTREAGDGKLLDADGHVGVGVLRVDLENGLAIVTGLQALVRGGAEGMVRECNERSVHAASVTTGEESVLVVGVLIKARIAHADDFVSERIDLVVRLLRDVDLAFVEDEAVVG